MRVFRIMPFCFWEALLLVFVHEFILVSLELQFVFFKDFRILRLTNALQ